jgi:hypothetical protein
MKKIFNSLIALAVLVLPAMAHAQLNFSGDITGGGNFTGSVNRANAWIEENPIDGLDVNFWTLTGNAGDTFSFEVTSSTLEFGMSLYQGVLEEMDLLVPGFDNSESFAGLFFVTSTPEFGAIGTQLLNVVLPSAGAYVLAIGGEGFGFENSYAYNLSVTAAPVPLPAAAWLLGSALLGLGALRRRRVAA